MPFFPMANPSWVEVERWWNADPTDPLVNPTELVPGGAAPILLGQGPSPGPQFSLGRVEISTDLTHGGFLTHRIPMEKWHISLHLVDVYGKCGQIYHTWILWVRIPNGKEKNGGYLLCTLNKFCSWKKQVNKVKCRYKYIPYPKDPDMS